MCHPGYCIGRAQYAELNPDRAHSNTLDDCWFAMNFALHTEPVLMMVGFHLELDLMAARPIVVCHHMPVVHLANTRTDPFGMIKMC